MDIFTESPSGSKQIVLHGISEGTIFRLPEEKI
jgi:hypothetical protein